MKYIFTIAFSTLIFSFSLFAQTVQEKVSGFNGGAISFTNKGDTLFVGGNFSHLGNTGSAVVFNTSTNNYVNDFPSIEGNTVTGVHTAISDGNGGWYVGGDFAVVDGVSRKGIIHIQNDNTIDANWAIQINSVGYKVVDALHLIGDTLYVGGEFTSIGDSARKNLAAIDVVNKKVTSWNPNKNNSSPNESIFSITSYNNMIFVGGGFSSMGDSLRKNLAVIDKSTGEILSWKCNTNRTIQKTLISNNMLYLTGNFDTVGIERRRDIAEIDIMTASPTSLNIDINGIIMSMDKDGSILYLAGYFDTINTQQRNGLASIDITTSTLTNWAPLTENYMGGTAVFLWGNKIYAAADRVVGSLLEGTFFVMDKTTGAIQKMDNSFDEDIYALAGYNDKVFVGGLFSVGGGVERTRLAAVKATTGELLDRNIHIAGKEIRKLFLLGDTLYIAGEFDSVAHQPRKNIAAIYIPTMSVLNWNPSITLSPNIPFIFNGVFDMFPSGNTIYVSGDFSNVGDSVRINLAAIDKITGNATMWNPKIPAPTDINFPTTVKTITKYNNIIYAGGEFLKVGDSTRRKFVGIDENTGLATATNFNMKGGYGVHKLVLDNSKLYICGWFDSLLGQYRKDIAIMDLSTGTLDNTIIQLGGNSFNFVYDVFINGPIAYLGGNFEYINGIARLGTAAIDKFTGNLISSWNPSISGGKIEQIGQKLYIIDIYGSKIMEISEAMPLPVTLSEFKVTQNNNEINVLWSTASEINNYGFAIERKNLDEKQWHKLNFIQGHGTSSTTHNYVYKDKTVQKGEVYSYRLKQIDTDGKVSYSKELQIKVGVPETAVLLQNYPNPFNPTTEIQYYVPTKDFVTIKVFNILGEEIFTVVNKEVESGYHSITFNAVNISSGVYFYKMQTKNYTEVKKMTIIK